MCLDTLQRTCIPGGTWQEFSDFACSFQESFSARTSRKSRRAKREPFHVKQLRRQIVNAPTSVLRDQLAFQLWQLKRHIHKTNLRIKHLHDISGGRTAWRAKKLHHIERMYVGPGDPNSPDPLRRPKISVDHDEWRDSLLEVFKRKWLPPDNDSSDLGKFFKANEAQREIDSPHF